MPTAKPPPIPPRPMAIIALPMYVVAQDSAVAIDYVTRLHRLVAMLAPETADLTSPFKPPRA